MQPKIHEDGNPGRPVISSVNCHTIKNSQYVDHHLQPHAQELLCHAKALADFIKKGRQLWCFPRFCTIRTILKT